MKHLFTLIKKTKLSFRRKKKLPLLDMVLMNFAISYMIIKTIKSLGVEM